MADEPVDRIHARDIVVEHIIEGATTDALGLTELTDMAIHTPKDGQGVTVALLADLKRRIRLGFPDADSIDVHRNKSTDPIWVEIRGPGTRLIHKQIQVHEYTSPVEVKP